MLTVVFLLHLIFDDALAPSAQCSSKSLRLRNVRHLLTYRSISRSTIEAEITDYPECAPILSHVLGWIEPDDSGEDLRINGHVRMQASQWTQNLLAALDTMLVAVQHINNVVAQFKEQREAFTLLEQQALLHRMWSTLQVDHLVDEFQSVIAALPHVQLEPDVDLASLASIVRTTSPIMVAFSEAMRSLLNRALEWHIQLNSTGYSLAQSFIRLAEQGFCTPSEKEADSKGQAGDLEAGTGLGDGEGAEDISKDIADDEDLSGLAEEKSTSKAEDMKDEKDAVDMADEEFEGDTGDVAPQDGSEDGDGDDEAEERSDLEEQAGDGDLAPEAIDEKIWDGEEKSDEQSREADGQKGKSEQGDDTTAADARPHEITAEGDEETPDAPQDQEETVESTQESSEKVDPHTMEQDNLDLPEDMAMDGNEKVDDEGSDADAMSIDGDGAGAQNDETNVEEDMVQPKTTNPEQRDTEDIQEEDDAAGAHLEDQNEEQQGLDENEELENMLDDHRQTEESGLDNDETFADDGTGPERNQNAAQRTGIAHDANDADDAEEESSPDDAVGGEGGRAGKDDTVGEAPSDAREEQLTSSFRQLGNMLERWYEQHRNIADGQPSDAKEEGQAQDMSGAQFQHLRDEDAQGDAQALGPASMDQSAPLDRENAMDIDEDNTSPAPEQARNDERFPSEPLHDENMESVHELKSQQLPQSTAVVGEQHQVCDPLSCMFPNDALTPLAIVSSSMPHPRCIRQLLTILI